MRPQRSDAITPTKQSTTKSCASFMRYTVSSVWGIGDKLPIISLPVNIDSSSLFGPKHGHIYLYDGIVQDCGNSSVIALEILQFCGKPYIDHIELYVVLLCCLMVQMYLKYDNWECRCVVAICCPIFKSSQQNSFENWAPPSLQINFTDWITRQGTEIVVPVIPTRVTCPIAVPNACSSL